jgi:hypothetical protein
MSGLAASDRMRVLIVEDEPLMAEPTRDGLRLKSIAVEISGDGDTGIREPSRPCTANRGPEAASRGMVDPELRQERRSVLGVVTRRR